MNALAGAAPAFVFDLIARHAIRCEARRNGTLRAAIRAEARGTGARGGGAAGAPRSPGGILRGRASTGDRHRALSGAMLDRRGGDLNPLELCARLARAAPRAGAAIHGGTRALGWRAGALWQVQTAAGTVTAEQVVLATNGYTDDLWPGLRRTIVPLFGAIAATAPLPDDDRARRHAGPRRALRDRAVTVYYRVDGGERLLIGGRGPMREISDGRRASSFAGLRAQTVAGLAASAVDPCLGRRLAMTTDQYPHIHEPAAGCLACLGYNGRGVAMSTAMGAQLARRIVESQPVRHADHPHEDHRFHALWPLAVRAAIAHGRLSDLLGHSKAQSAQLSV